MEGIKAKKSNSAVSCGHKHSFACDFGIYLNKDMKDRDTINARSHSEWVSLINEWVHNEKDRMILKRYLLDGISIELLAEEFDYSITQMQRRITSSRAQLFKHL